ncbi:hypothetical protein Tco_0011415 [Tanacetum coccineum]
MNDVHDRWDKMIESGNKLIQFLGEMLLEQAANIDQSPPQEMSIQDMENLKQHYLDEMLSLSNDLQIKDYRNEKIDIHFRRECESMMCALTESTIPLNEIVSQIPPSIAITPFTDFGAFLAGYIESDSDCDLSLCDDFSPINIYEEKSVTFSNPFFDSNDDFTSSDDESLFDEDVPEDNVKIYSNPLFEFDDEYISSGDVDEIELLLHRDPYTPKISVVSILKGFTDEPPLEENGDLFDLECKENEWMKILYDAPIDDLMTEDKVFDPRIYEKIISSTYVSIIPLRGMPFSSNYYVIRIFLPYLTYSMDSSLLLSSESEDTIFDLDIPFLVLSRWYLIGVELSCASMFI